jgi:hypothetical protein
MPVDPIQTCIAKWNAYDYNIVFYGPHFYNAHGIREAWVFTIPNTVAPSILRCQVVFSDPPDDPNKSEFGTEGEVSTVGGVGWQVMDKNEALQQEAPQHVNASLMPDYTLQRKP